MRVARPLAAAVRGVVNRAVRKLPIKKVASFYDQQDHLKFGHLPPSEPTSDVTEVLVPLRLLDNPSRVMAQASWTAAEVDPGLARLAR
jgi:hypothetical protein